MNSKPIKLWSVHDFLGIFLSLQGTGAEILLFINCLHRESISHYKTFSFRFALHLLYSNLIVGHCYTERLSASSFAKLCSWATKNVLASNWCQENKTENEARHDTYKLSKTVARLRSGLILYYLTWRGPLGPASNNYWTSRHPASNWLYPEKVILGSTSPCPNYFTFQWMLDSLSSYKCLLSFIQAKMVRWFCCQEVNPNTPTCCVFCLP